MLATIGFPAPLGPVASFVRRASSKSLQCSDQTRSHVQLTRSLRSRAKKTYIFLSALPKVPEMKNQKQTTTAYADDTGPRMAGSETRELWDLLWPRNQPGNLA